MDEDHPDDARPMGAQAGRVVDLSDVLATTERAELRLVDGRSTSGVLDAWSPTCVRLDHPGGAQSLVPTGALATLAVLTARPARPATLRSFPVELERAGLGATWTLWLRDGSSLATRRIDALGEDIALIVSTEGRSLVVALRSLVLARRYDRTVIRSTH